MSILDKYNFPNHVRERVMTKVAQTISQLEDSNMVKTSGSAANVLLGSLAAGAVAYGLPKMFDAVSAARIRSNKEKYLEAMKRVHPELRMYSQRDLDIAYNSLAIHTPNVLEDPLVGGQMIKDMAARGSADLNQLRTVHQLRGDGLVNNELEAVKHMSHGVSGYITYSPRGKR
jgi:hypothetical protein